MNRHIETSGNIHGKWKLFFHEKVTICGCLRLVRAQKSGQMNITFYVFLFTNTVNFPHIYV